MVEMTRKERVLDVLSDGEWHAGYLLCHPDIGGSEGLRRVRELRADGYEIKKRRKKNSRAYEYRLMNAEEIEKETPDDWFNCCSCDWLETDTTARVIKRDMYCPAGQSHPQVYRFAA